MYEFLLTDAIRSIHLLCFALGMGPAVYYDVRSMARISLPVCTVDIEELQRIHKVVSLACAGLWASGITIVWVQTSFDLAQFSPKLWSKLGVVSVLTLNAFCLSLLVLPALARWTGNRLIDLPVKLLLPMTFCAGLSLSCWVLALALGSSRTLKTADWDLLIPFMAAGSALCIGGVLVVMFGLRAVLRRTNRADAQSY